MMTSDVATEARQVLRYLAERERKLQGGWVSVADIRGAVGLELEAVRGACLLLHERGYAELVGGFPLKPTTERFSLARLSEEGGRAAADQARLDREFGPPPAAG